MANFTESELNELSDNLIKLLSVMGESHYKDMEKSFFDLHEAFITNSKEKIAAVDFDASRKSINQLQNDTVAVANQIKDLMVNGGLRWI